MPRDGEIDYYAALGVPPDASALEIRRAYRRLAREHHPDLNAVPDAAGRFVAVSRAYETLNDPTRRAHYDHALADRARRARAPSRSSRTAQPAPGDAVTGVRGILELTFSEAEHLARFPLVLTDTRGRAFVVPAGTGHGSRLTLDYDGQTIVLSVRVGEKA